MWRSPDGGFTWSQQWSGEGDLPGSWRVHFLNPLIGHISGQAGAILGTNDGGLTWTRLNRGIARDWNGLIAFSDSQVILVGHHGYVQSTRDAGAQWTPLLLDPPSFRRDTAFSGISIADATTAVVVGHWGSLFKTVDQGATWMNLSNSLNPGYYANAVTFNDANNGWIAGVDENGGPRSHIRRTYDGGLTWETASLNVPSIDIRFINQAGYVLTTSQPLYQTTDGGATWTAKNITGATTNERMSWASDNVGYVAGWQGFLAKTTDGGDTWSQVRPAQRNALYFDVMAAGENEVWACGIDRPLALVIRSLDGGSTWTDPPMGSFGRWFDCDAKGLVHVARREPALEVVAELPTDQRTYEFTVPIVPPSSNRNNSFVRILAVDEAGQEGWDDAQFFVPYTADWTGTLTVTTDVHRVFRPGERTDLCWTASGMRGLVDAWVFLDGDDARLPVGTGTGCLVLPMVMPYASTDSARFALSLTYGAGGRVEYFFSDYFSIRPDPRVGDEPPSVEMTAPLVGDVFPSAGVVPIAWSASDDRALQSFALHGSFDGGRTWHFIAPELPPAARTFDWLLPPLDGIPDARVRVIARDSRFQNSSSGADRVFSIAP